MPSDSDDEVLSDEEIVPGVFTSSDGDGNLPKQDASRLPKQVAAAPLTGSDQPHFRNPSQAADETDSDEVYTSGDYDANGETINATASKAARRSQAPVSDDEDDYEDDDD